jgi:hypothetical protein
MTYTHKGMCTKVCYTRDRYYSTYRKDISDLPWKKGWKDVEGKVHKEQMALVELAMRIGNTSNEEILKLQRRLVLSKSFRMLAVHNVLSNKGSGTAGTDKIILRTDKEK